ncbi:MAG: class I SAM-dependent methyltransferase [Erysipelotrichaceae bacterium]|nr:class I SAM-dependent methyltransferase [Erysipelotrichaceae bacterium]
MKSYDLLANFYDRLIIDQGTIQPWIDFTAEYGNPGSLLELACGSGIMTLEFLKAGYQVTALDLSAQMLEQAAIKTKGYPILYHLSDMRDFHFTKKFDTIVCFNDSLNYLTDLKDVERVFDLAYQHLKPDGCLLFDVHTTARLKEFSEEFVEEGYIDDTPYQWCISAEDNSLYHTITFYQDNIPSTEQHVQTVFTKAAIKSSLTRSGFNYLVFTDFNKTEKSRGEKWFFAARRR